jgi:hypothetical protein
MQYKRYYNRDPNGEIDRPEKRVPENNAENRFEKKQDPDDSNHGISDRCYKADNQPFNRKPEP